MSNELSCCHLAVMRSDGAPCISHQDRGTSRQRDLAAVSGLGHLGFEGHASEGGSEATGKENAKSKLRHSLYNHPRRISIHLTMAHPYPSNKLANYPGRVEAPSLNSNNNTFNILPFFRGFTGCSLPGRATRGSGGGLWGFHIGRPQWEGIGGFPKSR